jgi:hypothetical protein
MKRAKMPQDRSEPESAVLILGRVTKRLCGQFCAIASLLAFMACADPVNAHPHTRLITTRAQFDALPAGAMYGVICGDGTRSERADGTNLFRKGNLDDDRFISGALP